MARREDMDLRLHESRTIRLPSLSGAGYAWAASVADGDPASVSIQELEPDQPSGPPGQSPDHVFRLSAERPGQAVICFEQRRPWEADAPAHDTRTVNVVVHP